MYNDFYFIIDGISLGGSLGYSEFDGFDFNVIQYNFKCWFIGVNIGYLINEFNCINFGLIYSNVELFNCGYYE